MGNTEENFHQVKKDEQSEFTDIEKFNFREDARKLFHLILDDSDRGFFLRELINMSCHNLDSLRLESDTDEELFFRVIPDYTKNTLSFIDNGIGMTKQDLVDKFCTVLRTGTNKFIEELECGKCDMSMFGEFGVGFCSALIVASHLSVTTKHTDDEQYVWVSHCDSTFTVAKDDLSGIQLERGTKFTLYLRPENVEYLDESRITDLASKYSKLIGYPIYLRTEKTIEKKIEVDEPKNEEIFKGALAEWELIDVCRRV